MAAFFAFRAIGCSPEVARIIHLRATPQLYLAPMGDDIIVVKDLKKTYPGGVEAVRGVSFAVKAGEFFGFLGPNGAGKTTTINM